MAVNAREDLRKAVRLLAKPWFRDGLDGRNRDGERVIITATLDTPFSEVLDAIAMGGDGGNLVVFEDRKVTVIVIEHSDISPIDSTVELQPVSEEATVGMFLDVYRSTKNAKDITFAITRRGYVRSSGFQRELAAV